MTITRRSLMVLGVLLAVLAASTGVAQAQTPAAPTVSAAVTYGYGGMRITITAGANSRATDTYRLRYEEVASGTAFSGIGDVITPDRGTGLSHDIIGLKHGTRYVFAAQAMRAGEDNSAWSAGVGASTLTAPALGMVQGVQVTAMDKGAMIMWTAIADVTGAPIHRYEWRVTSTSAGGSNGYVDGAETEAMATGLANGVEYTVQVRAWASLNGALDSSRSGGWSTGMRVTPMAGAGTTDPDPDPDPTPTPAVPLAGILALFAGLLAAARSRLRRR